MFSLEGLIQLGLIKFPATWYGTSDATIGIGQEWAPARLRLEGVAFVSGIMKMMSMAKGWLIVLLLMAARSGAEVLVLPPGASDVEGDRGSFYPFGGGGRIQQLYTADLFPSASPVIEITSVAFRIDADSFGGLHRTFPSLTVQMSTTQKSPTEFGNHPLSAWVNHGSDLMITFQGSPEFDSGHPGGGRPAPFAVRIPLQQPFRYERGSGNLVLELTPGEGGPGAGRGELDAFGAPFFSLIYGNGERAGSMLATQFDFRIVPEPAVLALAGLSAVIMSFWRRRG